jgi:hypothetical protein
MTEGQFVAQRYLPLATRAMLEAPAPGRNAALDALLDASMKRCTVLSCARCRVAIAAYDIPVRLAQMDEIG